MFKDRDLFIIGLGALLAVFCLLLPFSFAVRVFAGFAVLIGFMVLALVRLGPDRVPAEEWLRRLLRYRLRARRYTYQRPGYRPPRVLPQAEPKPAPKPQPAPAPAPARNVPAAGPVGFAVEADRVYHLAGALLFVVAAYFLAWLVQGGAVQIAADLNLILKGVRP